MTIVQNVPFFSIMLCMICGIASAMLGGRAARRLSLVLSGCVSLLSIWLLLWFEQGNEAYNYMMGHFPAPWGNELRAGPLEAIMASALSLVTLFSLLGGYKKLSGQVHHQKENLTYVMMDLVLAACMSMLYTNDLFTGYVFLEIMTLASCALMISRQKGHTLVSGMRYMIMSLLGSGLTLIAIAMVYGITGQLLMQSIHEVLESLAQTGEYELPLTVIITLFMVGLGIKSGMYPFHTWLPDAYGYATPAAGAMLSSVVSKAYLFLLIKILYRVVGMDILSCQRAFPLLFIFGIAGMIMGSVNAISCRDLRHMIACSSVAQVGYIYAALGLGTQAGFAAALFHMIVHAFAKSGLFISGSALSDASDGKWYFADLRGSGFRTVIPGLCFSAACMSLIGIPMFGGFITKLNMAQAAFEKGGVMQWVLLAALVVSTILNLMYLMRTVITLYRNQKPDQTKVKTGIGSGISAAVLGAMSLAVGLLAEPLMRMIQMGLEMFQ